MAMMMINVVYNDEEDLLRELFRRDENLDIGLTGRMLRFYTVRNGARSPKCAQLLRRRFLKRLEQRLMQIEPEQQR